MLLGQMPGQSLPGPSNLFAVLPSYAAAMSQFLNRFGPYRLLPYAAPTVPDMTLYQPVPPMLPVPQAAIPGVKSWLPQPSLGGAGKGPYAGLSKSEARQARIDDMMRRGIASAGDPFGLNSNGMSAFGRSLVRSGLENGLSPGRALHSAAFAEQRTAARGRYATPSRDTKREKGTAASGRDGRSANGQGSNRGPGSRGDGFGHAGGPR